MTLLDLFSGIGGFSLAASWAGIETVGFCEREPFCQKVLKKHWPDVPIVYDIFKLRGDEFGTIDIISGGFPCQPFSVAGQRRGTEDDRAIWPEMFRIIKTARPTWVLGENVAGIVSMELDNVLSDLESEGYTTQAFIVPACAVDARHRRDRVWIVAHAGFKPTRNKERRLSKKWIDGDTQNQRTITRNRFANKSENVADAKRKQDNGERRNSECEWGCMGWEGKTAQQNNQSSNTDSINRCGEIVSNTMSQRLQNGDDGQNRQRPYVEFAGTNSEHERSKRATEPGVGGLAHGLPSWLVGHWPAEPEDIPRTAKGIKNRTAMLKGYGNAIVPQVAYQIFKSIMEVESGNEQ